MELKEEIYNDFEKYINCGISCDELEDLKIDVFKVICQLEKQNEKLQQEKKELLKALKKVNEIRDQLLKEKKELKE